MVEFSFGIKFQDLYSINGLEKIDQKFLNFLSKENSKLLNELIENRVNDKISSEFIISLAPYLEHFIISLFNLEYNFEEVSKYHIKVSSLFKCRKKFIQRKVKFEDFDKKQLKDATRLMVDKGVDIDNELSIAVNVLKWMDESDEKLLKAFKIYAGWALYSNEGKGKHKNGVLFKIPKKLDFNNLIDCAKSNDGVKYFENEKIRHRDGFNHTDQSLTQYKAIVDSNYCLYCHKLNKDSCSKGLINKDTNEVKSNPLDITLKGCPLGQKISEMNFLKKEGIVIGALATAIIDNPMIAATGNRICNDCMKSCIFQNQEPVDIPLIESKILDDVLKLDYGFEIYSLLTKWNPLKSKGYLPKTINNYKVLVVGMGPAGFTLAHYLSHEGFTVVGADGLKIEPMSNDLSGITLEGNRTDFKPIKNISEIMENLSERKAYGFGGVSEYGITVRWNKNYLTILRLILERKVNFRMFGGVRFGSSITYDSAKNLGFNHVALAIGAGKPNIPNISNILCKGVKTASDFLMTLQTLGPARKNSLSNLQIRFPIVVIGGGLTSIDAATESLAYYPVMVEKFLIQFEKLGDSFFNKLSDEEIVIAKEYIYHAKQLRKNSNDKLKLLKEWGGVKIIYRRRFEESPAYKLNHEEVEKALEEGVEFIENTIPIKINVDKYSHCEEIICNNKILKSKTIIIAAGTSPNTTLAKEDNDNFKIDGKYFSLNKTEVGDGFFTKVSKDFSVSVLGDSHPKYSGSVVKAMASAKHSYSLIANYVLKHSKKNYLPHDIFFNELNDKLTSKVVKVNRLTNKVVEVIVKSQVAVSKFKPGQFYRLQNYEVNAQVKNGYLNIIEPLALTGATVDKNKGIISLIILEMGGSSDFCQNLKKNEIINLMGPTGSPTYIPKNENVILIGGGLGNAVLFSIGKALLERGCYVLYFAGYKKQEDIFKVNEIEQAASEVIWCCDESKLDFSNKRRKSFHGNIIEALQSYDSKFSQKLKLREFHRMLTIGSDSMMKAVSFAVKKDFKDLFNPNMKAFASINSPMQCMMKEICAQCLQKHIDPITNEVKYVYSCYNQDQNLKHVDFDNLSCRLMQNSLLEKITSLVK